MRQTLLLQRYGHVILGGEANVPSQRCYEVFLTGLVPHKKQMFYDEGSRKIKRNALS